MDFDAYEKAKQVLNDWLINTFEDADLTDVLNTDPDMIDLSDEEFDMVLDRMRLVKLISVRLQ